MKATILTRLKRLEEVQAIENLLQVEFQIGYLKSLPVEYAGERHIVTVGRDADGTYEWEECRGPAPHDEGQGRRAFQATHPCPATGQATGTRLLTAISNRL